MTNKAPLGQNFLVDPSAVRAIVDAIGPIEDRLVLEIGPGGGALTSLLAARAGQLIAIEYDRALAASLAIKYSAKQNVRVLPDSVLDADLTAIISGGHTPDHARALVIGNLPYYITSDILLHLVAHQSAIETAVVMMQREVAERVTAAPGSRDYGLLSVTIQMAAEAELLFTLPPEAFSPPPQVHSSVVRLHMRPRYAELGVDRVAFEKFVRTCFAQKRKTLASNLRAAGHERDAIECAVASTGASATIRAEALSAEQLAAAFHALG